MRVALTGASGFIGRNLCAELQRTGHDVLPLARGYDAGILHGFNPEWIFHVAAEIYQEDKMFASNVSLTYALLQATADIDYKAFVYVGSSSEYGRKSKPMSETDCLSPTTMYEATKACGSLLCQAVARARGKPIVIARPFSVYGMYEPEHRLIPRLFQAANTGAAIKLSHAVHDFIYIDDVVRALLLIAENPISGDIVNLGTGTMTSNIEAALTVERATGKHIHSEVIDEKLREFDSAYWCCDPQHAVDAYKFTAGYSLNEGLCAHERRRAA